MLFKSKANFQPYHNFEKLISINFQRFTSSNFSQILLKFIQNVINFDIKKLFTKGNVIEFFKNLKQCHIEFQ